MTLHLQRPLAIFDLETTGTRIGQDRIVQFAAVRLMPDGSRDSWQSLVNPGMPIPAEATAVHGIRDADVADAPRLEAIADHILDYLDGSDLGGFNVIRFDLPLLCEELHRVGRTWDTTAVRVVDAMRIFHKFEPRDLSAAARFYLGHEHVNAHDAMGDVEVTADVLLAQVEHYEGLTGLVDELGELSGDRNRTPDPAGKLRFNDHGTVCLGFGKYKGWALETIGQNDPGYMHWLLTKAELPPTTAAIIKEALADHAG